MRNARRITALLLSLLMLFSCFDSVAEELYTASQTGSSESVLSPQTGTEAGVESGAAGMITRQPEDRKQLEGGTVKFTVKATGATAYRWQASPDGVQWAPVPNLWEGYDTDTLVLTVKSNHYKLLFRCEVTGPGGTEYTRSVKVTEGVPDAEGPSEDPSEPPAESGAAVINIQPVGTTASIGDTVTLTVNASNASAYRWQYYADGKWNSMTSSWTGYNKATLTIIMDEARFGYSYRCRVTGTDGGHVNSDAVTITKAQPPAPAEDPVITKQPRNAAAAAGETVTFRLTATDAASYRWQVKKPGASWALLDASYTGYNKAALTVTADEEVFTWQFRCRVTGTNGTKVYSDAVCVKNTNLPVIITRQPQDMSVTAGSEITLSVAAENADSYQWQYSPDGETWKTIPSSWETVINAPEFTLAMTASRFKYQYRCRLTGASGTVYSRAVTVTRIQPVAITGQPSSCSTLAGGYITLSVTAENAEGYCWQYSSDGETWKAIPSSWETVINTSELTLRMTASRFKYQYRCKVSGPCGPVYSRAVRITRDYPDVIITSQPQDTYALSGEDAVLTVTAENAESYRWQFINQDGEWKNIPSTWGTVDSRTLVLHMSPTKFNYMYRCAVSGHGMTVYSDEVWIYRLYPPVITIQPANWLAPLGGTVMLWTEANNAESYRWQYSKDGGETWNNVPSTWEGYDTDALSFEMTSARFTYLYRCAVTGSGVTVYTDPVSVERMRAPEAPVQYDPVVDVTDITISWSAVDNADYYQIKCGTKSDLSDAFIIDNLEGPAVTITGFERATTWYFRVYAVNSAGTGSGSNLKKATTAGYPAVITQQPESCMAFSGDTVTLSVKADNAESYRWQYSNDGGSTWKNISTTWGTSDSRAFTMKMTATRFEFLYRCAVTGGGTTVYSSAVSITRYPVPGNPQSVKASTAGSDSITVSWSAPSSGIVTGYRVYYNTAATTDGAKTFGGKLSADTRSLTITGLDASTNYYVWVTAFNPTGEGDFSSYSYAATSAAVPGVPLNVSAAMADSSSITVSWSAPTTGGTPAGYSVYYGTSSSVSNATWYNRYISSARKATIIGLTAGTKYYIWVIAYNSAGCSDYSAVATATTAEAVAAPGVPTGISASANGSSSITVSWSAPSTGGAPAGYSVYYGTSSSSGSAEWYGNYSASSSCAAITGLSAGTKYYVWVRAYNSAGFSSYSASATATTGSALTAPGIPAAISASATGTSSITVSWSAPTSGGSPSGYSVYYGTSSSSASSLWYGDFSSSSRSGTITGLSAGTKYYVWVRAYNSAGYSSYSAYAVATTNSSSGVVVTHPNSYMQSQISKMKGLLPAGSYWHRSSNAKNVTLTVGSHTLTTQVSSYSGCSDTYYCGSNYSHCQMLHKNYSTGSYYCDSSSYGAFGTQCHGFANLVGFGLSVSGRCPSTDGTKISASSSNRLQLVNNIAPGDFLRIGNDRHAVMVIDTTETSVIVAQCNAGGPCVIRWGDTYSRSELMSGTNILYYIIKYDSYK